MLMKYIPENFLQYNDKVSCVTGVTVITGTLFITQDRISDTPGLLEYAVEEALTESKRKSSVAALYHIQDFIHDSNIDPINWEDLTHDHTTKYFWGKFATYMGKYTRNKKRLSLMMANNQLRRRVQN